MYQDAYGHDISTVSRAAARAHDRVVASYAGFRRDTGALLKQALEADPECPMMLVLKGYFFNLMGSRAMVKRAQRVASDARVAAMNRQATDRELSHIAALEAWTGGDLRGASIELERILVSYPRDMLALKIAHFMHFYLGDVLEHRNSLARVLPAWNETVPGYAHVLGMAAFGLEEAGDYAAAERTGRRAVELDPTDTWSVHAVAHVLEMQERAAEGVDWIDLHSRRWQELAHNFQNHVWWHKALFHLQLDDQAGALDLYDRRFWGEPNDEYLDITNAVSFLLRLEFRGVDVGRRWDAIDGVIGGHVDGHVLPFIDAHIIAAVARSRGQKAADSMLKSMQKQARRMRDTSVGQVAGEVGAPLSAAVAAHARGDHETVIARMMPIRARLIEIGGSHAQRDVFDQMLIASALAAGKGQLARALLHERAALRPASPQTARDLATAKAMAA